MERAGPMLPDRCSHVITDRGSIRSDLSSFSYSPPISAKSRFRLEEGYPSINTTLEHARRLSSSGDSQAMRGLAQVFSQCLSSIIPTMDSLPEEVRTFPDYEMAHYGAVFTNGLLSQHTLHLDEVRCDMVLEIMEMTFYNLKYFLEVAGRLYANHTALPISQPSGKSTDACLEHDEATTSVQPDEQPTEIPSGQHTASTIADDETPIPEDHQVTTTPESFISELPTINSETDTLAGPSSIESQSLQSSTSKRPWELKGSKFVQRVLRLRPSLGSRVFSARSKSATTLVGSVDQLFEHSTDAAKQRTIEGYMRRHKALPDIPYILRQSAVYFLPDPLHPEVDVDMPELNGETVAVRLSPQGEIKSASLTALIRMVTSKDVIKNPKISQLFFCSLGYLISPQDAIAKLAERFNEHPPSELTVAQLRVWTREELTVRIRVGHVVALWLEQYWDAEIFDLSVLIELEQFALTDLLGRIPDSLFSKIILFLEDVICGRASRRDWRKRFIDRVSERTAVLHSTGFESTLLQENGFSFQLSHFFVSQGIEEFSRNLTRALHDMHCTYEPSSAVRCWFLGNRESEVHSKLQSIIHRERSLYLWVTREILNQESKEARVDAIEFWVRVAWECVSLHNFSCASAIHGALVSPPIYRLKETLMAINVEDKKHFKTLDEYFSGFDNYGRYRQAIDDLKDKPQQSYIPLLAPLIRDMEIVKAVKPTVSLPQGNDGINLAAAAIIQHTLSVLENGRSPYKFERTPLIAKWQREQLLDPRYARENDQVVNAQFDQLSTKCEAKCVGLAHIDAWAKLFQDGSIRDLDQLDQSVDVKKPSILSRFLKKP
ncbi:hypothetical protein E1B28_012370 [Marasmius oreades]|uniref:Ras GEF n=1 Tax=Marasmius oreades TaxID=181124 RepID=A0A9P7UN64_9AGAR|nr:uncharacterized protein E1B28_012370 [Marasmius oreades]KAG7088367.1 hypothetical protein E1B28_012370 [Marasmius oreades]